MMRPIEWIVVHHTAGTDHPDRADIEAIRRWHVEGRGWRDIGYHLVIERAGGGPMAIVGRPWHEQGAHCPPRNHDSIGVAIVGDFSTGPPDEALFAFTTRTIGDLCMTFGIAAERVVGHREAQPGHTQCPGHLDLSGLRLGIRMQAMQG